MQNIRKRVALDIDGVILKGGQIIKGALNAITKLQRNNIPFVFVTNGGGMLEVDKAQDLSKKLKTAISPSQILLSHTPMRGLARGLKEAQVLVLGNKTCLKVAQSYGFLRPVSPECVFTAVPQIFPGIRTSSMHKPNYNIEDPIRAVLVFHDPVDWALDMQIASDVLSAQLPDHPVPLYACNNDLVYVTEYHRPRYTQGAFLQTFRHLYEIHHGVQLPFTCFGKPYKIQYDYAEQMLHDEAERIGGDALTHASDHKQSKGGNTCSSSDAVADNVVYFGVGDNPLSDIRGANNAGDHWRSILVRTGVFQGGANDPVDPADQVAEDVEAAVDYIIEYNSGNHVQ